MELHWELLKKKYKEVNQYFAIEQMIRLHACFDNL